MSRTGPGTRSIGFLLNHASRAVMQEHRAALRLLGLDEDMWIMIQNIRSGGELGAEPVESADRVHVSRGSLVGAAERLVRAGWAQPAPERPTEAGYLVLTKKALDALPGLDSNATWLIERATSGFTHEEVEALGGYLARIIENMA